MHGDHFTEHQPRIDRVAVGGGELNTLRQTALKVYRTLRDPGALTRRLAAAVRPARTNSSSWCGIEADVSFIAMASGRVARFQTNSFVSTIFRTLSFQPLLAKPMIGGR